MSSATAVALSASHGIGTLCRSLDTLHVALAMELGATEFCTFDLRQSRMAAAAGLVVNARNVAMILLTPLIFYTQVSFSAC
jgi:hypothetical protein